jgi:hypothetical protein
MSEQEQAAAANDGASQDTWYSWFLYALGSFAVSGFLWWYFTDFETHGGRRRINAIVALLYNMLGKTATCGLFALLGVIFLGVGVSALRKPKA